MAVTNTDIANRALSRLSQTAITSIDAPYTVEKLCKSHFESVRQQLLRSHPWNFALRREPLGQRNDQPRFGPRFEYQLPPGYIGAISAFADLEGRCKIDRFDIENGFLMTDHEEVYLLYVEDKIDPTTWDASFTEGVVLLLASRICVPITGDPVFAQSLLSELEQVVMPKAMLYNAREDMSNENSPVSQFVNGATINRVHQSIFGYGWVGGYDLSNVNQNFY